MVYLVDSPFPGCSGQGNSQKSRGPWAWHWSITWSHFSRRNNCKGNHPLLHKWRTNSKNPHSLTPWEVRTCQEGKARSSCWKPTQTDSGQTCTGFDPVAQCLRWPHGKAEPDFPQIQASFWYRKKRRKDIIKYTPTSPEAAVLTSCF